MRSIIFLLLFIFFSLINYAQDYFKITGKVVDSRTKIALPFSSVYLSGTRYCGTVSNENGDFILKIPKDTRADSLRISFLGYKTLSISLVNLNSDVNLNTIELQQSMITLKEVTINPMDPGELIETAIQKIPENYDIKPIMMNGFYREIYQIKPLDFKSKDFSDEPCEKEAVFDIYRSPFQAKSTKEADPDYIKLLAWRKTREIKDTMINSALGSLKGSGPNGMLNNDPLKNIKNSILWKSNRKNYIFKLKDITTYDNHNVYVIEFDQSDKVKKQLYKGTIYIDIESMAFVAIDYRLSPKGAKYNSEYKILFIEVKLNEEFHKIVYKKYDDKWNIYFIQNSVGIDLTIYSTFLTKSSFKKSFPGKESITMGVSMKDQFVITDVEKNKIIKYTGNELFKSSTELKVEKNKDNDDIWGKYNLIKMP